MILMVRTGVANYKAALEQYKQWCDKMMKEHGAQIEKIDAAFGRGQWGGGTSIPADVMREVEHWWWRIEGMQEALGLFDKEIAEIDKELGFATKEQADREMLTAVRNLPGLAL